jgi:type II secretory pathway component GspD/PulD (secretin)
MRTLSLSAASTVLAGILVASSACADSRTLVTIPLRHQLPSQVLPVIQPLLASGSTAAEFNNQLVLNATDEEVAKVRKLLAVIDRQPRELLITVLTPGSSTSRNRGVSVDGSVGSENVRIGNGNGGVGNGDELRIGVENATSNESRTQQQQVRAVEGMPAQISIGVTTPVTSSYTLANGQRVTSQEYYPVNQGVNVVARVVDGRVILDIDQQNDRLADQSSIQGGGVPGVPSGYPRRTYDAPTIRTQSISTQVSGRIGEWIPLGGIDQSSNADSSGLGGASRSSRSEVNAVMIKVDVLGE